MLVAELSGAIGLVPVIALGVGTAVFVGDHLSKGIYDTYLDDQHTPLLMDPAVNVGTAIVCDRWGGVGRGGGGMPQATCHPPVPLGVCCRCEGFWESAGRCTARSVGCVTFSFGCDETGTR